ncbi:MAG: hypothetical protein APR55_07175 [Methanolinea sp. SDB]|nr:MAG: hypothetical protein APR55_07175 [Methanolinea sp. SDB]
MLLMLSGSNFLYFDEVVMLHQLRQRPVIRFLGNNWGIDVMAMSVEGSAGQWYSSVPGTDEIYQVIEQAMGGKDPNDRIRAVIALGDSGDPRAVRPLVLCCSDKNPVIRRDAVVGLGKLRSARAVDALIERLGDRAEEKTTRIHAVSALAAIGSYSAIEGLNERYSDLAEDPGFRACIREVLLERH